MKHIRFTPLLLTALLLTGCASGQTPTAEEDDIVVITETPPATTVPETEPETETWTEPETETEPTTQALPEFDSPQEAAYYYVRETLAEEYGLSDLKTFAQVKGKDDKAAAVTPPTSSQGLISAYAGNLSGGKSTELLTVRCDGFALICELYTVGKQGCERVARETIAESTETALHVPAVSLADGHLVVRDEIYAASGVHYSGMELRVYDITAKGLQQAAGIGVTYDEGAFTFTFGKEKETYDVTDIDFDGIAYSVRDVLQGAGLSVDSVRTAFPGAGVFNIDVLLPEELPLFTMEFDRDEGAEFVDETSLRDYLSGKKKPEAQDKDAEETDEDETDEDETDEDETAAGDEEETSSEDGMTTAGRSAGRRDKTSTRQETGEDEAEEDADSED